MELYLFFEFHNLDKSITLINYEFGLVESNYFINKMDYIPVAFIINYSIGNDINMNIGYRLRCNFAGNFRNYIVSFSFNVYFIEIFINVT